MAPTGKGLIAHSVRAYPARTALMVLLLFLAGVAEGIGLATLLPLLELVAGGTSPSAFTVAVGDALARVGLTPRLEVLLALIVIGMAFKAGFRWAAMVQVGYTVAAVATDLRLALVRALLQARWSYFAAQPAGHFANALSMEAYRASAAYREACAALASAIQASAYLALAFLLSWQVALVALLAGIVLLLALNGFVRMSWRAGRRQTDRMMSLVAHLVDALQGLKPLKAMAREAQLWRLLEREAREVDHAQRRQVLASETLKLLQEPLLVVMVAIGLYVLLRAGNQPFATVLVMVFLFHRIVAIVHRLQGHYQSMASGASAYWSVRGQVERTEAERETSIGTRPPPPLTEGIRLEGVGFTHGATPILHDVSLFIPAGRLVALVGPSGAGKTTLADVIVGLHRPAAGAVYVDGVPMAEVDLPAWRRTIGYVPQESLLLHDTIASNVALGDAEIDDAAVEEALRAAGAWDFVAARPEGMHAIAGERGGMMSGGQAQRIALARALVRKPRLLVLDEVTSGLDAATEAAIFETLLGMRGAVTILFISHRSAVVDAADLVIRIDAGAIEVDAPARASAR